MQDSLYEDSFGGGPSVDGDRVDGGPRDARTAWLAHQLAAIFKPPAVAKLAESPAFIAAADSLLGGFSRSLLVVERRGVLSLPDGGKGEPPDRVVYVVKINPGTVSFSRIAQDLLIGTMSSNPLTDLEVSTRAVFLPLMTSNHVQWSEVVSKEVVAGMHGLLAQVAITTGASHGVTRLPLPQGVTTAPSSVTLDRVHEYEGCIVRWTKQIKAVLRQDPESLLANGVHPEPLTELDFWDAKAHNLNSIFSQLQSDAIRRMLRALDAAKSTYAVSFGALCREVFVARTEANDNVAYLRPLRPWFQALEAVRHFTDAVKLFRPILHAVLNVWKYSRFYKTPTRLVVLMREVCNCLIRTATGYVSGDMVFRCVDEGEARKPVAMLLTVLKVCGIFKSTYFDYKARVGIECRDNPWRVQNSALFSRLDRFLERCHDMRDFVQSVLDFSRLEQLEVGGTKGKTLTTSVQQIFADFQSAVVAFRASSGDVMDVDGDGFDDHYYQFRVTVKELERRLGSVLTQGFEDAPTTGGRFKLLDSFEALLERPIVAEELERKHLDLLMSYADDIGRVQAMFVEGREAPPTPPNMPPCAGALCWARGLLSRVQLPMEKLRHLNRSLLDREEARALVKAYTSLVASLADFEHARAEEWGRHVESASSATLKKSLLTRAAAPAGLLHVNFDPALVRLLREVKYFTLLGLSVPAAAQSVYKRAETFRTHTGNLELIVNMYNSVVTSTKAVERPLLSSYLQAADRTLAPGLNTLNWKSHGIDVFIAEAMNVVRHVKDVLVGMTHNLRTVQRMMAGWAAAPMMQRNKSKPLVMSVMDPQVRATVQLRYQQLASEGRTVAKLLKDTNRKVKVSQGQAEWKAYVDYVNSVIVRGLLDVARTSLQYLATQLDPVAIGAEAKPPLLEVALDLVGKEVQFTPALGHTHAQDGVRDRVMAWVDAFVRVGTLFTRLDGVPGNYVRELQGAPGVMVLLAEVDTHLCDAEAEATSFRDLFTQYAPLWTQDIQAEFTAFIATAHGSVFEAPPPSPPPEDGDTPTFARRRGGRPLHATPPPAAAAAAGEDDGEDEEGVVLGIKLSRRLDLGAIGARVDYYRSLQAEVVDLRHSMDLGFLRVNAQPIKQALGTWVTKWMYTFTSFLADYVAGRLQWLAAFMREVVEDGLTTDVGTATPDGRAHLMAVIRNIRRVRRVQERASLMFEPLQDTVDLLRHFDHNVQDTLIDGVPLPSYLANARMRWDAAVNTMYKVKEGIQGPQFALAEDTRATVADFKAKTSRFREAFLAHGPFTAGGGASPDAAYATLDSYHRQLTALEAEAAALADLEELFELAPQQHSGLEDTREDLGLLKLAWDMVELVGGTFEMWSATHWAEINADDMLVATVALQGQVAAMPGRLRTFPVYDHLAAATKRMATVLPLVQELRSPAVRDRHWTALMLVTRVSVDKGPDFKLADVLRMGLHSHVADVQEVLETAHKDLKTEMRLKAIEEVWATMDLRLERYKDSDVQVLNPPDTLMADLEDHMLSLQAIFGLGRFAEHFLERATAWQAQLSAVEATLRLWLAVQRQWMALESIFLGTSDIRASLPDDAKRFEGVDTEWKEVMREAEAEPGVLAACTFPGRAERLGALHAQLEVCEKALTEYLDVKKNAFPRLYFLSNAAVLDILANSANPPAVVPHLGACFEALTDLRLEAGPPPEDGGEGAPPPVKDRATALVAKDGETVLLDRAYTLAGPVESWLGGVVRLMQSTLRGLVDAALDAAAGWGVDQPRETWVFGFPSQVVQVAALVFWTEEAEAALEEFEGGAEDAVRLYRDVCTARLHKLVEQVQGTLDTSVRTKLISLITQDVHGRDVLADMLRRRVGGPTEFAWQSQLRCFHSDTTGDMTVRVCDFAMLYNYEYAGNVSRLVITPLTDRCYITLTMAMRLTLGGAPSGPAGTGKTETTKDLARALGLPCYVFNCSDQMTYVSMASILAGLSQTGAWGCFDEFNRISVEVLSVVATQITAVLAAVRRLSNPAARPHQYQSLPEGRLPFVVGTFPFAGDTLNLVSSVGVFITMNPGYAGRTELPENLKALFRPCAMIRPDVALICENMLMAEGFVDARPLSLKIVALYDLSAQLLSSQRHYDWGLRAIKSLLRIAGALKRTQGVASEATVLLQALHDCNMPKLVAGDIPLFQDLLRDLAPKQLLDAAPDEELLEKTRQVCGDAGLQPVPGFVDKVCQLDGLLHVRHSVMLLGGPGTGKTSIWRALAATHNLGLPKPVAVAEVVNPKALTVDELYGYVTLARDWADGVLSILLRSMINDASPFSAAHRHKWVVLDGDIDSEWIESMNSLMDDNKTLTLVSNERLPLSPSVRLLFEISSLEHATPATVSRAGMLYVNDGDVPWGALVSSWIARRPTSDKLTARLQPLFDKYVGGTLGDMEAMGLVPETGAPQSASVAALLRLLDAVLGLAPGKVAAWAGAGPGAGDSVDTPEKLEAMFVFCCVWALGGCLPSTGTANARLRFSQYWKDTHTGVKFPKAGTVFDVFFVPGGLAPPVTAGDDVRTDLDGGVCRLPWSSIVPGAAGSTPTPTDAVVIPTVSTTRLKFLCSLLLRAGAPVMLVGHAGTGKTVLARDALAGVAPALHSHTISLNYYTDAAGLQAQMEDRIEKRSGRMYGPPGNANLVVFVDDLNLPLVGEYGTQAPIALLRQWLDGGCWFDRGDLSVRRVVQGLQALAAMNPTAGSFTVNPRLQRHFVTLAVALPSPEDMGTIFGAVLSAHFSPDVFTSAVVSRVPEIVAAIVEFGSLMPAQFLPSAANVHYSFNLRHQAAVVRGMCLASPATVATDVSLMRLWLHETRRVYGDRMSTSKDVSRFHQLLTDQSKRYVDLPPDAVHEEPCLFTTFPLSGATAAGDGDGPVYAPVPSMRALQDTLYEHLREHNKTGAIMDLVLFDQAAEHVARAARILSVPCGSAMLVGVGGSGKQSLARLAAAICGYNVVSPAVSPSFTVHDLRDMLKDVYMYAGSKPALPVVFLMTDSHVLDERFLVYVNDLLSTGVSADLYTAEELDAVAASVRQPAKAAGLPDSRDSLLDFFVSRVRANVHTVLCFSPVGGAFRVRCRRFPALTSCTSMDWFHAWPREALISVAATFLEGTPLGSAAVAENLPFHMAEVHSSVVEASAEYVQRFRAYNYCTPKSYLELIALFKHLLGDKQAAMGAQEARLETGLATLRRTGKEVETLEADLRETLTRVEEQRAATETLLEQMGKQRGEAHTQHDLAAKERTRADAAASEAAALETEAQIALESARPALEAARRAVDCLDKASLTELKSMQKPPPGVDLVTKAVQVMLNNEKKNLSWEAGKRLMANVLHFKNRLEKYRGDLMPDDVLMRVSIITDDPIFTPENMAMKSYAAANLCTWVLNMMEYKRIYTKVAPLMAALEAARESKLATDAALAEVEARVGEVEARLASLQQAFLVATGDKAKVEAEAEACSARLDLAQRLVVGLESERVRWEAELNALTEAKVTVVGDVMLSAAFVGYAGAFNSSFRAELWQGVWLQDLLQRDVAVTEGVDPLGLLVKGAAVAQWQADGLPHDRFSTENGAIVMAAKRWPLLVDPQLQGLKWLSAHHRRLHAAGANGPLLVLQTTHKDWLKKLKGAVTGGGVVILENVGEEVESCLEPLLSRSVRRSGRQLFIRMGDDAVDYDPNFRLYLQTRLPSPHFRPEVLAQCTLLSFVVTQEGLEEQLLALVVKEELPELEDKKDALQQSLAEYQVQLVDLESRMLEALSEAPADILSDVALIENLEASKRVANDIGRSVEDSRASQEDIEKARDVFRPVAAEGSMLFFTVSKLCLVDHMYQYSLRSFIRVFFKGMARAPEGDLQNHVDNLTRSVRLTVYNWASRGLLEKHKLVLLTHLLLTLMNSGSVGQDTGYSPESAAFLMKQFAPPSFHVAPDVSWLAPKAWVALQDLAELPAFASFLKDLRANDSRFREWYNHVAPEREKLPLDWRELDKTPFLKLLVVRAMRPDRMIAALTQFVEKVLPSGHDFVACDSQLNSYQILSASFEDASPDAPMYFLLSVGSDIGPDMAKLVSQHGMVPGVTFHEISLGQGQDAVAEETIRQAKTSGHWVLLNNAHLMPKWLHSLDRSLSGAQVPPHHSFRLFISSEPSPHIPIGLLGRCVKLTNEPPTGLQANLKRAFRTFAGPLVDDLDMRTRGVLFGLCYFHAIMTERRRFGAVGFNRHYPFSASDLLASATVLRNYMDYSPRMPWEDLQYLFGEIMYGGHIVNDFDRLLCNSYLQYFLKDDLLDEMEMCPFLPEGERFAKYVEVIDASPTLAHNSPLMFGLHPNADIGHRTLEADGLFQMLTELQPGLSRGDGAAEAMEHIADGMCQDLLEEFKDLAFDDAALGRRVGDDITPFALVFMQECTMMNALVREMARTLSELEQGLRGVLQLSSAMESLMQALVADRVPDAWARCSYPSLRPLAGWLRDLRHRWQQLLEWIESPEDVPAVTWLGGLFKPQSFLTAVLQVAAEAESQELDTLVVATDVMKKDPDELTQPAREGAYITGLYLEGARWTLTAMRLEECKPKEMFCPLPVVHLKAAVAAKYHMSGVMVPIPVYRTQARGDTYVFTARLRSKEAHAKWVMAGAVLVMEIR